MNIRSRLRSGIARILYRSGLTAPAWRARDRLSIVTFHHVLPEEERRRYPYPNLVVTPEELDEVLRFVRRHFECGPLALQQARHRRGEEPRHPLLAVTFDDGQYDNFLHARPVLARHGVQASFFVPVAAVENRELLWHDRAGFAALALLEDGDEGAARLRSLAGTDAISGDPRQVVRTLVQALKRVELARRLEIVDNLMRQAKRFQEPTFARLMTFAEIRQLCEDGHEIGSHSMTHCLMPECDDAALRYELEESRRILQAQTGSGIESFCYPNGACDARAAAATASAGYLQAVTTRLGSNARGADPMQLCRVDMDAARLRDSPGPVREELIAYRLAGFRAGASLNPALS